MTVTGFSCCSWASLLMRWTMCLGKLGAPLEDTYVLTSWAAAVTGCATRRPKVTAPLKQPFFNAFRNVRHLITMPIARKLRKTTRRNVNLTSGIGHSCILRDFSSKLALSFFTFRYNRYRIAVLLRKNSFCH